MSYSMNIETGGLRVNSGDFEPGPGLGSLGLDLANDRSGKEGGKQPEPDLNAGGKGNNALGEQVALHGFDANGKTVTAHASLPTHLGTGLNHDKLQVGGTGLVGAGGGAVGSGLAPGAGGANPN